MTKPALPPQTLPSADPDVVPSVVPDAAPRRSQRATVAFAAAAMLVSYLPLSAVNGVLGVVGRSLSATTRQLTWVTGSFTVALVLSVLAGGSLAERFGRRLIVTCGLGLTTLGCALGFLAPTVGVLWAAQAVSGLGAGLVMSATLALIAATAPSAASRTRSIAVWTAGNVAGLGVGPFVAGAATHAAGWRWLYPPIVVLAVGVAAYGLACSRETPPVPAAGWLPRLSPRLLASRGFDAAGLAAAAVLFAVIGVVFVLSLTLAGHGVDGSGIAVRIGCLFAGNALASLAAGSLQVRFGSRPVLVAGLAVTTLGLAALLDGAGSGLLALPDLAWRLALFGAGAGTVVATSTAVAVQSVPGPLAGQAGTANSVLRQVGGALGSLVVGGLTLTQATGVLLALLAVTTVAVAALVRRA